MWVSFGEAIILPFTFSYSTTTVLSLTLLLFIQKLGFVASTEDTGGIPLVGRLVYMNSVCLLAGLSIGEPTGDLSSRTHSG